MEHQDEIVRLLTEIPDNQIEDIALRKRVTDESLRLQRLGVARQRAALLLLPLALIVLAMAVLFLLWALSR